MLSIIKKLILILFKKIKISSIFHSVICFNPALTVMMDITQSPLWTNDTANSTHNYASWSLPLADRRFQFTNLQKSFLLAGQPKINFIHTNFTL